MRCPTTKTRYGSELSAMASIARIGARSRRDVVPRRAYRCHLCRGWHMTSQRRRAAS